VGYGPFSLCAIQKEGLRPSSGDINRLMMMMMMMRNTADVRSGKPIAVWSQYISGASAVILLVAFYDIHDKDKKKDSLKKHQYRSILALMPLE
jgi:hypothetical protein